MEILSLHQLAHCLRDVDVKGLQGSEMVFLTETDLNDISFVFCFSVLPRSRCPK